MSEHKNIEAFDELFRKSFESAGSPVPPGVWEGIASSTTGAAASGTGILSSILSFKGAAIIGTVAVLTASYFIVDAVFKAEDSEVIQPAENVTLVEDKASLPAENMIDQADQSVDPNLNSSPAKPSEQPISSGQSASTGGLQNNTEKSTRTVSPTPSIKKSLSPETNVIADQNRAVIGSSEVLTLKSTTNSLCVNQAFAVEMQGVKSPRNIQWSVNNLAVAGSSKLELMFDKPGLYSVMATCLTRDQRRLEASKTFEVKRANAAFTHHFEDDQIYLQALGSEAANTWFINNVKHLSREANVVIPALDTRSVQVIHVADNLRGCSDTVTKVISIHECKAAAAVYDFSPHLADGVNDEWVIDLPIYDMFYVVVFDANGSVVFESRDQKVNWNGRRLNQGALLPIGYYTYQLVYECDGERKTKSGRIALQ